MPVSFIICGPSNGFQAFRLPEIRKDSDDTLAIPGSLFEFNEGGVIYCASRRSSAAGISIIRFGVYAQAFEPNLRRAGHSDGAILEYSGETPDISNALELLTDLVTLIKDKCVKSGSFCNAADFNSFLTTDARSVVQQMTTHLRVSELESTPCFKVEGSRPAAFVINDDSDQKFQKIASYWNWFVCSPGGMCLSNLIVASATSGGFGSEVMVMPDIARLDSMATQQMLATLRDLNKKLQKSELDLQSTMQERNTLASNLKDMEFREHQSAEALADLRAQLNQAQIAVATKTNASVAMQGKSYLTENDLARIKRVVVEAIGHVDLKRRSSGPVQTSAQPQAGGAEDWSLSSMLLIGFFVVAVIVAAVGAYMLFGHKYF